MDEAFQSAMDTETKQLMEQKENRQMGNVTQRSKHGHAEAKASVGETGKETGMCVYAII